MKIVLASSNSHKVKEINEIAGDFCCHSEANNKEILRSAQNDEIAEESHKDTAAKTVNAKQSIEFILPPEGFDPDETGTTFAENSLIKAQEAWKLSRNWTLADDSGLCIDALDGKPGIYSARYAETPQKRIERVLRELEGVENRTAHFICSMTLINPKGEIAFTCEGICKGQIIKEAKGTNGFGYDPIFLPDGYSKTIAELPEDEKNRISHRSKALGQVMDFLQTNC